MPRRQSSPASSTIISITSTTHRRLATRPSRWVHDHAGCSRCSPQSLVSVRAQILEDYNNLHDAYKRLVWFLVCGRGWRFEDAVRMAKRREEYVTRAAREERRAERAR